MARSGRRKIWTAADIVPGAPFNREVQTIVSEGKRPSTGSIFSGGEGGATDGARRDATEGDVFGRKPNAER